MGNARTLKRSESNYSISRPFLRVCRTQRRGFAVRSHSNGATHNDHRMNCNISGSMPDSRHTAPRITLIFAAMPRCHYNFKAAPSITGPIQLCAYTPLRTFPPSLPSSCLSLIFFFFSLFSFSTLLFFAIPFTAASRFRPQSSGDFKATFRCRRRGYSPGFVSAAAPREQPKPAWHFGTSTNAPTAFREGNLFT